MSEQAVQHEIMAYLNEIGFAASYFGGPYSKVGMPDILACVGGQFFAFEVKLPGKLPSVIQTVRLEQISGAGGHATVVHNLDETKAFVEACLDS